MRITVGFGLRSGTISRSRSRRSLPPGSSDSEPTPVLIEQQVLAEYRLALMQALSNSPQIKMTMAYGVKLHAGSAMESLSNPPGVNRVLVQNHYLENASRTGYKLVCQSGLMHEMRSGKYKVMIAEFNPRVLTNLVACLYAKILGIRFIWWGHGIRPRTPPKLVFVYQIMAWLADALILYSDPGADQLAALGVPREKMFVAWNTVDTSDINAHAKEWNATSRTRILDIGRLLPAKKPDLLLRGFAQAAPSLPSSTKLTLVGEGSELSMLEQLAKDLGIEDRVEFTGAMYGQEQLAPYFNTSWVSVSPGFIGLNAIHSLAYGLPMLVADKEPHSPEIAAVRDEENARFFTADDPKALSDTLIQMANQPDKLAKMSKNAKQLIQQQFSIAGMVASFERAVAYACRNDS